MTQKPKLSVGGNPRLLRRGLPAEERFFANVNKTESCWLWLASGADGYGSFMVKGKYWRVHRWAYERFVGSIPNGLFVCHKCDVRNCVNPAHLFLGTNTDNMRDASRKGRLKTGKPIPSLDKVCRNGHPRTPENTRLIRPYGRPSRDCLICKRAATDRMNERIRAKKALGLGKDKT